MTSKLAVFNEALRLMGERRLTSVTEGRDARYHLDDAWTTSLDYCLEQGFWNFAMRAVQIDASTSLEPQFGYSFAFDKPDDWVRTFVVSANETFNPPLLRYNDEAGIWYADCNLLYVRYVSNAATYGADIGSWPGTFSYYVSAR